MSGKYDVVIEYLQNEYDRLQWQVDRYKEAVGRRKQLAASIATIKELTSEPVAITDADVATLKSRRKKK